MEHSPFLMEREYNREVRVQLIQSPPAPLNSLLAAEAILQIVSLSSFMNISVITQLHRHVIESCACMHASVYTILCYTLYIFTVP